MDLAMHSWFVEGNDFMFLTLPGHRAQSQRLQFDVLYLPILSIVKGSNRVRRAE
jgi:hypothetical protein